LEYRWLPNFIKTPAEEIHRFTDEIENRRTQVHHRFWLKWMEVCTTGGRFSQTTDRAVDIVFGRKGSFLPTPECDMTAGNALVLRRQIHRSLLVGLSIEPIGTE